MHPPRFARTILTAALVLVSAAAPAGPLYYLASVYDDAGATALDFRYWQTTRRTNTPDILMPELGLGRNVTGAWYTEVYAGWVKVGPQGMKRATLAWQNDYLFTQGQYPFDLALHTNLEHNTDRTRGNNIEIGPVLQTEWYRWFFNAGVFADRDVDAAAPGRTRAKYQLLAKYRMQESFEAGVLVFGEAGDWDAAPGAQRGHRVGPVFMGALPVGNGHSFRYELSWLRGTIADRRTRNFNARLQYVF
jgi:hypothetical protein